MNEYYFHALAGVGVFTAIGLAAGVALALAAIRFKVTVDPRIMSVKDFLPGANCGACGFAGCESYAEAVVSDAAVPPNKCRPGGAAVGEKVAAVTGKEMGEVGEMVCVLRCGNPGGGGTPKHTYLGWQTCAAADLVFGGPNPCPYGCVGLGDCARACPFGAISLAGGRPVVDQAKCTGCGVCAASCPKSVLDLAPRDAAAVVACLNPEKGQAVKSVCDKGCLTCLLCVKKGPEGVFRLENDRINVDYQKALGCTPEEIEKAIEACKPGAITTLERIRAQGAALSAPEQNRLNRAA